MRIDVHVHLADPTILKAIQALDAKLTQILSKETQTMALIDDLTADVTAQTTVVGSAVTLLQGLKAALDAAGTDPAKLQAIKDGLDANTKTLADAVAANTPAAPPAP